MLYVFYDVSFWGILAPNRGSNPNCPHCKVKSGPLDHQEVTALCCAWLLQSCPTLCGPMDHSPPGSSVHGVLRVGILEWVAMPSSRGFPDPGIEPVSFMSPALGGRFPTRAPPGRPRDAPG